MEVQGAPIACVVRDGTAQATLDDLAVLHGGVTGAITCSEESGLVLMQ